MTATIIRASVARDSQHTAAVSQRCAEERTADGMESVLGRGGGVGGFMYIIIITNCWTHTPPSP